MAKSISPASKAIANNAAAKTQVAAETEANCKQKASAMLASRKKQAVLAESGAADDATYEKDMATLMEMSKAS